MLDKLEDLIMNFRSDSVCRFQCALRISFVTQSLSLSVLFSSILLMWYWRMAKLINNNWPGSRQQLFGSFNNYIYRTVHVQKKVLCAKLEKLTVSKSLRALKSISLLMQQISVDTKEDNKLLESRLKGKCSISWSASQKVLLPQGRLQTVVSNVRKGETNEEKVISEHRQFFSLHNFQLHFLKRPRKIIACPFVIW